MESFSVKGKYNIQIEWNVFFTDVIYFDLFLFLVENNIIASR